MRSISDTIARLHPHTTGVAADRLTDLADVFDNPGALHARCYVPDDLAAGAALVVVLHGCTQTAAGYDHGSGWSELADRYGFALLFPEQTRANNPNLCFNWFQPGDTTRGQGEVASICAMIEKITADHALDPARVFVTGLSAGGAMTAAMLATYPEIFASGAIVAGLPHGTASSVPQAMERMRGSGLPDRHALAQAVRGASAHRGPWPRVSVWHGTADATVAPATGEAVVAQWLGVHDLSAGPSETRQVDGDAQRFWHGPDGRVAVEAHAIAGMGHGTPLDPRGEDGCGTSGPFMLDVGVSSTLRIAESWGLTDTVAVRRPRPTVAAAPAKPALPTHGVGDVIEGALRAAGLMR
ncbi:alpha/beta hydrolase family esterase [Sphingomonas sp.]|uniref:extracellular catalytic domain type 1 short-chain-length polyhydroxyalkanoate depolymerase n=1 Tax=Sphingomonas sp. TaxID=28214 RepID=UPI0035BBE8C9